MQAHLKLHEGSNDSKTFQCALCDKMFGRKDHMQAHLYRHYRVIECRGRMDEQYATEVKTEESEASYECCICNPKISYASADLFKSHLSMHFNSGEFRCGNCDKHFATKNDLFVHLRRDNTNASTTGDKPVCKFCHKPLANVNTLKRHLSKSHADKRPQFPCCYCDEALDDVVSFSDHLKKHSESARMYKCAHCDKSWTTKGDLRVHELTHGQWECDKCKCIFPTKLLFSRHQRGRNSCNKNTTAGAAVAPVTLVGYECNRCDRSFLKKVHLARHLKQHDNDEDVVLTV